MTGHSCVFSITMSLFSVTFTSSMDIAAYLCAGFILVTFILSVCIPAEKCKPSYKRDKEAAPRVPLEIYVSQLSV